MIILLLNVVLKTFSEDSFFLSRCSYYFVHMLEPVSIFQSRIKDLFISEVKGHSSPSCFFSLRTLLTTTGRTARLESMETLHTTYTTTTTTATLASTLHTSTPSPRPRPGTASRGTKTPFMGTKSFLSNEERSCIQFRKTTFPYPQFDK